jgi:hypothetical protein
MTAFIERRKECFNNTSTTCYARLCVYLEGISTLSLVEIIPPKMALDDH